MQKFNFSTLSDTPTLRQNTFSESALGKMADAYAAVMMAIKFPENMDRALLDKISDKIIVLLAESYYPQISVKKLARSTLKNFAQFLDEIGIINYKPKPKTQW